LRKQKVKEFWGRFLAYPIGTMVRLKKRYQIILKGIFVSFETNTGPLEIPASKFVGVIVSEPVRWRRGDRLRVYRVVWIADRRGHLPYFWNSKTKKRSYLWREDTFEPVS